MDEARRKIEPGHISDKMSILRQVFQETPGSKMQSPEQTTAKEGQPWLPA